MKEVTGAFLGIILSFTSQISITNFKADYHKTCGLLSLFLKWEICENEIINHSYIHSNII